MRPSVQLQASQTHRASRPSLRLHALFLGALVWWAATPANVYAQATDGPPADIPALAFSGETAPGFDNQFAMLSIEQLMEIQVTSVAGVAEDSFKTPAAIYVITNEDIRRSGHQLLPEVMRMVPGSTVARLDSRTWQVNVRGFEGLFSDKLLVLMDGRHIYDPSFGGVFWDAHEVIFEDLQQVEVIRGPGATIWGANAVNGVINITSKSAKDTQGLYATGLSGTSINGIAAVRYGGQIDDHSWFRVWGKYIDHDNFDTSTGADSADDWDMFRGGFRYDREGDDGTNLTIDGSVYSSGRLGDTTAITVPGPPPAGGGFTPRVDDGRSNAAHLLVRLQQEGEDTGWTFQAYADWFLKMGFAETQYERTSFDIDWKHHFRWGERDEQETVWGLRYHADVDDFENGVDFAFADASEYHYRVDGFVQNTWTLVDDKWYTMVGSKFEYNSQTRFEVQPSVRLWWTPDERQTLWAAVSRPIRAPSRADGDVIQTVAQVIVGPVMPVNLTGDRGVDAERLLSFEAGYRARLDERITLDVAVFLNEYDKLIVSPAIPSTTTNDADAETFGGEAVITWHPADNLRIKASYSYLNMDIDGSTVRFGETTPEHQGRVSLTYEPIEDIELNAAAYIVSHRPDPDIGSYTRLDVGLTWRVSDELEIAVWGQNLLDHDTLEATESIVAGPVETPRSMYVQATLRL